MIWEDVPRSGSEIIAARTAGAHGGGGVVRCWLGGRHFQLIKDMLERVFFFNAKNENILATSP